MRAIVYRKHGDIDRLEEMDRTEPVPRAGQALIEVKSIGLNPLDYRLRRGEMGPLTLLNGPRLTGSDFSGVVIATSGEQSQFQVGDRVMGMVNQVFTGVSADRIVVDERILCRSPSNVEDDVAATIPLAAYTAYQALHELGQAGPGKEILINGASGGVGTYATQLAHIAGAKVTAVTSHRNIDWMDSLGAQDAIDYTKTDFTTIDRRFDVVFDCYGNRSFAKVRPVLKPDGVYITTIPSPRSYTWSIPNSVRRQKSRVVVVRSKQDQLEIIKGMVEDERLRPIVDTRFERHEICDAYEKLETKRTRGKISVRMTS